MVVAALAAAAAAAAGRGMPPCLLLGTGPMLATVNVTTDPERGMKGQLEQGMSWADMGSQ